MAAETPEIVVHCAGILGPVVPTVDHAPEAFRHVIDVNLTGCFLFLQATGRHMLARAKAGETAPGAIVNISSDAGRRGTIGQINYGASKSGVLGLTMSSAREWAQYGIRVNSVCPGLVLTPMSAEEGPDVEAAVAASSGALARSLEATERELLLEALLQLGHLGRELHVVQDGGAARGPGESAT